MSRLLRLAAAVSMVAMLSVAAGGGGAMAAPGGFPAAQTTLPADVAQTQWVLEYFSNEDKGAGHDMTSSQITLTFAADGTLSGFGGCNSYGGSYTVSGQQMTISKLNSTLKVCADQTATDNETKYLKQLSAVTAYNVNNSKLELAYASGTNTNTMTFIPGSNGSGTGGTGGTGGANSLPSDVLSTTWTLQYLNTDAKAAGHDVTSSKITIKFAPDGTLSGFGGCNSYGGSYTVSGQQMTIGQNLISTQIACEQPILDQENLYFRLLPTVNAYNLVNQSTLDLVYSDGHNAMTFISGASQGGSSGSGAATTLPSDIMNVEWTLQYFSTEDQAAGHDVSSQGITIKFEAEGTVGGSGGCNSYSTTYTVSNQDMTISDKIASTRKACEQAVMDQESLYFSLLPKVNAYQVTNGKLELLYSNGQNTMTFISAPGGSAGQGGANSLPPDIINVEWTLQYFTNAQAQDVSSNHITITFLPDGTLEGNGGCNNYFGSYTVSGGQLTINDNLGSTQMFCEQAVMTRESLYFRLLTSVNSYQITGGKLELVYGTGENPNALTYISATTQPVQTGTNELPPTVLGTAWTLKFLDSNNTGQDVTRAGITIKFEPDGTFYGNDGCNDFHGSYTVSGGKLAISNVASTRKVCPDVDPSLGSRFLQLLASVKSYVLSGDQLSLDYQDTGSSLVFVRTTRANAVHVQPVVVVGMPTTGGGTPQLILLLLAGSLVALVVGFGLRRQVARKVARK